MSNSSTTLPVNQPVIIGLGEALYDCFPNREVLGGAPVNVAAHANALVSGLGGKGLPATRVGADERGDRFLSELKTRGIDTSGVQIDPERLTGTVNVTINESGNASYVFADNGAWDAFELTDVWQQLAESCDAVSFGTLGQRSPTSRKVIRSFLQTATGAIRLFDVNFRQDFYDAEIVEQSLLLATASKLNEDELPKVCQLIGIDEANDDARVFAIAKRFDLAWVAVTRGPEGTTIYADGQKHQGEPVAAEANPDADTVGAGDACCAGLLTGALLGWEHSRTISLANQLGAYVASHAGATPALPDSILSLVAPANE